ncbi:MAG: hypothetical protein HYT37_02425 [Candidatus Sungbacteria bacterium]|nr:hypothetical protein [Candidatus Sungbacteria bacterium]
MDEQKCKNCHKDTMGHKCDMCGEEAEAHNADHSCGGNHCVGKCSGCSEAETNCKCEA